jgi:hypothetical protein
MPKKSKIRSKNVRSRGFAVENVDQETPLFLPPDLAANNIILDGQNHDLSLLNECENHSTANRDDSQILMEISSNESSK